MNYSQLLLEGFTIDQAGECPPQSRTEFLARNIFDFTTYDADMDELLGQRAVEVCRAITTRVTHDYIQVEEQYRSYILMCNMPFFAPRLNWGTSLRRAWSDHSQPPLASCGLFLVDHPVNPLKFFA